MTTKTHRGARRHAIRDARLFLMASALVAVALCSCGPGLQSDDCPRTFVGGGEFTITFSGGIEGSVTGEGLDAQELQRYLDITQFGITWDGPYSQTGMTGALCHNDHRRREPCSAEFAGWLEAPEGDLTDMPAGTLVGVTVHQGGIQLVIAGGELVEPAGPVEVVDRQFGVTGSAEGKLPADAGRDEVTVEVEWALDESVQHELPGVCPPE